MKSEYDVNVFFFLIGVPVSEPHLFCDALHGFMMFYVVFSNACLKAPLPATFLIKTYQDLVPDLESSLIPLLAEMHFAISFVSALHVLHVSAVTAQPEPEAGCLLQSRGQLALKAEESVPAGRISFQRL